MADSAAMSSFVAVVKGSRSDWESSAGRATRSCRTGTPRDPAHHHRARARPQPGLQGEAERLAVAVVQQLDYVGVLAVELFAVGGRLLANEVAPRVHNSRHWTIDGAQTSQFEQHLRAIAGSHWDRRWRASRWRW